MVRVTDRRLSLAKHILDEHSRQLTERGWCNCGQLEMELRDAWGTGYRGIKWAMIDLYRRGGPYAPLAEYYMRNQDALIPMEFKRALGLQ